MREDPIISAAWIKAALVVLVGGALGVGAYLLVSGVDVDLPDLPDIEELDSETTNLSDTAREDTTIGAEPETPTPADPFTSAAFAAALAEVREAVGPGGQATRVTINDTLTQFFIRRDDDAEAYSVRAESGELERQEATITISGTATIEDFVFGLDAIKPSAIDRMLAEARRMSGAADFEPTVLGLERRIPFGSRELAWTISARSAGRNLTYRASANGSRVEDIGGGGSPIPPQVKEAEELNDCIQAAGSDIDAVTACFDRFAP
ncbi:MAG TPA: hypothetical protein VFT14_04580 [Solirubrobacterales bacterium]|nr:hypothetical protein [Solirubrobacterales bacterium]